MIKIRLEEYSVSATCNCQHLGLSCEDAYPRVSIELNGGNLYLIISDFTMGSWGLVTCIGGRGYFTKEDENMYLNDKIVNNEELEKISCFIPDKDFNELKNIKKESTVCQYLEAAIKVGNCEYSVIELKDIFKLTDERFNRNINLVSGEIWRISLAINYALGKEIFCFPWLISYKVCDLFEDFFEIFVFLKNDQKIILIPTDKFPKSKKTRKYSDYSVKLMNFYKRKNRYGAKTRKNIFWKYI